MPAKSFKKGKKMQQNYWSIKAEMRKRKEKVTDIYLSRFIFPTGKVSFQKKKKKHFMNSTSRLFGMYSFIRCSCFLCILFQGFHRLVPATHHPVIARVVCKRLTSSSILCILCSYKRIFQPTQVYSMQNEKKSTLKVHTHAFNFKLPGRIAFKNMEAKKSFQFQL